MAPSETISFAARLGSTSGSSVRVHLNLAKRRGLAARTCFDSCASFTFWNSSWVRMRSEEISRAFSSSSSGLHLVLGLGHVHPALGIIIAVTLFLHLLIVAFFTLFITSFFITFFTTTFFNRLILEHLRTGNVVERLRLGVGVHPLLGTRLRRPAPVLPLQHRRIDHPVQLHQRLRRHADVLVAEGGVGGQVLQQVLLHGQRTAGADLPDGVHPHGHHLVGVALRHEVVRDQLHQRLDVLRGDQLMGGLGHVLQQLRHLQLLRVEVPLEVGVEVQQKELVNADQAGDEVDQKELQLEALVEALQQLEETLRQRLRVVQQVNGGEVEGLDGLNHNVERYFGRYAVGVFQHGEHEVLC
ncbi:hypothetical protein TYRP_015557 [Tyrophagus putrescentiae]|nr:hypothetical protein TYRP_015557 [Tyrophagus putrescentiae]